MNNVIENVNKVYDKYADFMINYGLFFVVFAYAFIAIMGDYNVINLNTEFITKLFKDIIILMVLSVLPSVLNGIKK